MKNNKLPKGLIITSVLLSAILMATGCNTVQEVIDDYNPATQYEVDVYGPAPYVAEEQETEQIEQSENIENTQSEEIFEEGNTEYDPSNNEVTCDYGVVEFVE